MVVGLESGAALALCENDEGVEDLVEFGEVEPPAPEGKSFVPETAQIGRLGHTAIQLDESILGLPIARFWIKGSRIS